MTVPASNGGEPGHLAIRRTRARSASCRPLLVRHGRCARRRRTATRAVLHAASSSATRPKVSSRADAFDRHARCACPAHGPAAPRARRRAATGRLRLQCHELGHVGDQPREALADAARPVPAACTISPSIERPWTARSSGSTIAAAAARHHRPERAEAVARLEAGRGTVVAGQRQAQVTGDDGSRTRGRALAATPTRQARAPDHQAERGAQRQHGDATGGHFAILSAVARPACGAGFTVRAPVPSARGLVAAAGIHRIRRAPRVRPARRSATQPTHRAGQPVRREFHVGNGRWHRMQLNH